MTLRRLLWRLDRERLRVVWRRHGHDVTCCEHGAITGPIGCGWTWAEALEDFLRKREM